MLIPVCNKIESLYAAGLKIDLLRHNPSWFWTTFSTYESISLDLEELINSNDVAWISLGEPLESVFFSMFRLVNYFALNDLWCIFSTIKVGTRKINGDNIKWIIRRHSLPKRSFSVCISSGIDIKILDTYAIRKTKNWQLTEFTSFSKFSLNFLVTLESMIITTVYITVRDM